MGGDFLQKLQTPPPSPLQLAAEEYSHILFSENEKDIF